MMYVFIEQQCPDLPVATCCAVMGVSTSGFYQRRNQPVTETEYRDAEMTSTIVDIHHMSKRSYGSPRVHAELTLGMGQRVSLGRVERLMGEAAIVGVYTPKKEGLTRRDPKATPHLDLVERAFDPTEPDLLWCMDITEHPTDEGKIYLAAVIDAFSRRIVGWSIADHLRSDIVVDALQMAAWRRQPEPGRTIGHSDHGSQYTSWLFGKRLREAGLLGSMGSIGDCFDNSVIESFFGSLQRELLNTREWETRTELANAIFDWIETWYNPKRRHSYCQMLSPIDYETAKAA